MPRNARCGRKSNGPPNYTNERLGTINCKLSPRFRSGKDACTYAVASRNGSTSFSQGCGVCGTPELSGYVRSEIRYSRVVPSSRLYGASLNRTDRGNGQCGVQSKPLHNFGEGYHTATGRSEDTGCSVAACSMRDETALAACKRCELGRNQAVSCCLTEGLAWGQRRDWFGEGVSSWRLADLLDFVSSSRRGGYPSPAPESQGWIPKTFERIKAEHTRQLARGQLSVDPEEQDGEGCASAPGPG